MERWHWILYQHWVFIDYPQTCLCLGGFFKHFATICCPTSFNGFCYSILEAVRNRYVVRGFVLFTCFYDFRCFLQLCIQVSGWYWTSFQRVVLFGLNAGVVLTMIAQRHSRTFRLFNLLKFAIQALTLLLLYDLDCLLKLGNLMFGWWARTKTFLKCQTPWVCCKSLGRNQINWLLVMIDLSFNFCNFVWWDWIALVFSKAPQLNGD